MSIILISAGVVGLSGLVLGVLIAVMAKKFAVESDPRIGEIAELLPGANCGGCGFAGCGDLAKNIVMNNVPATKCPACSGENRAKINKILGRADEATEKMVAVVLCGGSHTNAKMAAQYNGVADCRTASIVAGGGKGCRFGCLGYGSCANACQFGAIEIIDGVAVVHEELCKGCGKCVDLCPRKLIKLVPASVKLHVYCNSLEKPVKKRKNCAVPCLACRKCIKVDESKMASQGTLVRINYANPPGLDLLEKAGCPTGALMSSEEHIRRLRETAKKGEAK